MEDKAREQARQRLEARQARMRADGVAPSRSASAPVSGSGSGSRPARAASRPAEGVPREGEARPTRIPREGGRRPAQGSREGARPATAPREGTRPASAPREGTRRLSGNPSQSAARPTRDGARRATRSNAQPAPSLPSVSDVSKNPKLLVALLLVLLIVAIIALSLIHSCSAGEDDPAGGNTPIEQPGEGEGEGEGEDEPISSPDGAVPDEALLTSILEEEALAKQLLERAQTDADVYWIAAHPEAYAVDGDSVQRKLLKLVAMDPEATAFVRNWPEKYPQETGQPCTETVAAGTVPLLLQWDERWGYTVYSSTTFALTGCCPTSLAMVYQGLTGKNDLTPYDLGVRADEKGYMTQYNGTDARFLIDEAKALGLTCDEVPADADELRSALNNGGVVIANVGPGDFTEAGHFIVLTGIDAEGNLTINDPFSAERSAKTWPVSTVVDQSYSFFVYNK